MIPLKIPDKLIKSKSCSNQEEYINKLSKKHLKKIKDNMTVNYSKIDTWIMSNLKNVNGKAYNFEKIILAPIDELRLIKLWIDSQPEDFGKCPITKKNKKSQTYVKELKSIVNWYSNNINKSHFIENLGLTVCPYCNRNYINVANISGKKRVTSQIDHFFPKSKYPLFALSFFNLMPVCPCCNNLKDENIMNISIYDIKHHYEDISFSYLPLKDDYLTNNDSIEIMLKSTPNMKLNISTLGLEELYKLHKDYVQEILKKKVMYSQDKVDELYENFKDLFADKDDVKRLIFGNYINDQDVHKRPLSKLTTDICKELNLL